MSDLYRKTLLVPGEHHAPQGVQIVTPQRIQRWVSKFKQLKSEGVKFPVTWGHRLSAIPEEGTVDDDEYREALEKRAFEEARFNSGYLENMEVGPDGSLVMVARCPPGYSVCPTTGDLINTSDGTRIGEVSAGIGNWQDGRGRRHNDIIIHAALVPLPVMAGQDGFQLATKPATLSTQHRATFICTLSTRTGGKIMAKKTEDEDELETTPDEDEIFEDDEPEEEPEPEQIADEKPIVEPMPAPDKFEQAIALLQQAGLALPDDTDDKNFIDRLVVALTFSNSIGMKFERPEDNDAAQTAPASAATQGAEQPPQPEAPPVMMSTLSIKDPLAKNMAIREERRVRKEIADLWGKAKEFGCPVYIANRESAKAVQVHLSLNTVTQRFQIPAKSKEVKLVLEVLEAMRSGRQEPSARSEMDATLSSAYAPPTPFSSSKAKKQEEVASVLTESLRRVSGDPNAVISSIR